MLIFFGKKFGLSSEMPRVAFSAVKKIRISEFIEKFVAPRSGGLSPVSELRTGLNSGYFRSAEIMNTPEFNSNSE